MAVGVYGHGEHHGVADIDGVTGIEERQDGSGATAQRSQVFIEHDGPYLPVMQGAELLFTVVALLVVLGGFLFEDAQHLVAPGLVAGGNGSIERIPTGTFVVDDKACFATVEQLAYLVLQGDTPALAKPDVVGGGTFGRGTAVDVDAQRQ